VNPSLFPVSCSFSFIFNTLSSLALLLGIVACLKILLLALDFSFPFSFPDFSNKAALSRFLFVKPLGLVC